MRSHAGFAGSWELAGSELSSGPPLTVVLVIPPTRRSALGLGMQRMLLGFPAPLPGRHPWLLTPPLSLGAAGQGGCHYCEELPRCSRSRRFGCLC